MKHVIKHLKKGFLVVAMFATLLSFANKVSVFTIKNEANITSITLKGVKIGKLLSIKDEKGIILHKEFIQKTGNYTKGFDLTELPDGTYAFEVDKDVEISTIPFTVIAKVVSFDKKNEMVFHKPIIKIVGNLLYVTKLSLDKSPLKIDIYFDENNQSDSYEPIYTEIVKNSKVIERVYKLSDMKRGNFHVICKTKGRTFYKSIN